ncbi:formate dehydrogenase subunit delta [Streptomyces sp. V3I7]|uniref:formate dehydrogenase subunit delta n=1 Tax=Streptomyces sp. V3I7 TaxID=3042278 RepID=UPI00278A1D45|nr:formate dehydrogenase subunit delta [Streptomyces sp. V3I7]MDQ0994257.1 formate dehydrogenase subunit delta [Streptomyces sp. V3I7]
MAATGVPAQYRMANDIANNLGHLPAGEIAEAVAGHIRRFWDPRMQAQLIEQVGQAGADGNPVVAAAAALLRN